MADNKWRFQEGTHMLNRYIINDLNITFQDAENKLHYFGQGA